MKKYEMPKNIKCFSLIRNSILIDRLIIKDTINALYQNFAFMLSELISIKKFQSQKSDCKSIRNKIFFCAAKLLILLCCTLTICHLAPQKAAADSLSLAINPSLTLIHTISPSNARSSFTLTNKSNENVKVRIIYKLFTSNGLNGQVKFLTDTDHFPGPDSQILQKVQVVDNDTSIHSLVLSPEENKSLQLQVIIPQNEPESDYYFSIVFIATAQPIGQTSDDSEIQSAETTVQSGIAMNVLLSIGHGGTPDAYVQSYSAPKYVDSGPVPFTLQILNTGRHFISPYGIILIKNMFGQTIGRIVIPATNILADSSRYLTNNNLLTENNNPGINEQTTLPQIIWPERYLFGFYTATLSLAISNKGPIYTKSVHFIAFPTEFLISLIFAIIILLLLYLRVKKYMNR